MTGSSCTLSTLQAMWRLERRSRCQRKGFLRRARLVPVRDAGDPCAILRTRKGSTAQAHSLAVKKHLYFAPRLLYSKVYTRENGAKIVRLHRSRWSVCHAVRNRTVGLPRQGRPAPWPRHSEYDDPTAAAPVLCALRRANTSSLAAVSIHEAQLLSPSLHSLRSIRQHRN